MRVRVRVRASHPTHTRHVYVYGVSTLYAVYRYRIKLKTCWYIGVACTTTVRFLLYMFLLVWLLPLLHPLLLIYRHSFLYSNFTIRDIRCANSFFLLCSRCADMHSIRSMKCRGKMAERGGGGGGRWTGEATVVNCDQKYIEQKCKLMKISDRISSVPFLCILLFASMPKTENLLRFCSSLLQFFFAFNFSAGGKIYDMK